MRKSHAGFIALLFTLISAALAFCMVSNIFLNTAAFNFEINDDSYFEGVDDGHTFKCYTIQGQPTAIAIGWLHSSSNTMPTDLNVPSTITSDALTGTDVTYTVVAIAKGGFRHCSFETITLPTTITEIREEAFAYCMNMTSFTFPSGITEIAPSTFLDCRNLVSIYYKNSAGARVLGNSSITRIGDHAFDSCVSLANFYCPSNATYFGESCFQKCTSLLSFNFPNDNGSNDITVKSYAFADCDMLASVYFEENMTTVEDYAFADSKTELTFLYTGSSIPTFAEKWRHKLITTSSSAVYDILINQSEMHQSPDYPGLFYTIDTADVKLDNARTNDTSVYVIQNSTAYASIYEFHTPFDSQTGYYDKANGILTIPNEIVVDDVHYTVKVIKANAFAYNLDLQHVIFNENLVQIQNHAFFHDTNIHTVDFSNCEDLIEISYSIFQDVTLKAGKDPDNADTKSDDAGDANQTYNNVMTSVTLPNCLQYLGNFAFYNFTNLVDGISFKTDTTEPSSLRMIGDYAFAVNNNHNWTPSSTEVTLELPNTLNDAYAADAKFFHSFTYEKPKSPNTINSTIKNRYAIGKNAFDNQRVLRNVIMEEIDDAHNTSFASNVFVRCNNLITFRANSNLLLMGNDMFKDCALLKEVFLCTDRADSASNTLNYPWGIDDTNDNYSNSLFMGSNTKPDCVIYVNGPHAPKKLYSAPAGGKNQWNVEAGPSYINELNYSSDTTYGSIRTSIPTFYNIDWQNEDDVIYWRKNSTQDVYNCAKPTTTSDYNNGLISIVKDVTTNKYTIAHYYHDGNNSHIADEIDLTALTIADDIETIGNEAFATDTGNAGRKGGFYFILPTSIKTISERAFYRKGTGCNGARIITYKSGSTIKVPTGEGRTYAQIKSAIHSAADANKVGYCCMPPNVEKIGRNAFYNHIFGTIELGASINFIGNAAFYTHLGSNSALRGQTTTVTFTGTNTGGFSAINDGIYYTANAAKKTLLYQSNGNTGALVIDGGTIAIGFRAAAGCKYSSVQFPNSLTTIYGCAFRNSRNLTTLTGLSSIQYINAFAGNSEVYTTSLPFDNYDFRDTARAATHMDYNKPARFGAFMDCVNLTNVDFTSMTAIKKIGWSAFKNDAALVNMANGASYSFYGTVTSNPTTKTTGVLDLRNCTNLTVIEKEAFGGCNGIEYVITRNSTGSNHTAESQLYFGKDPNGNTDVARIFPTTTKVLCGETLNQADQSGSGTNRTTHYPTVKISNQNESVLGPYTNLYYRVHDVSDLYSGNKTGRKYWTVDTNGKFYLFEGYDEAKDWLDVTANYNSQDD